MLFALIAAGLATLPVVVLANPIQAPLLLESSYLDPTTTSSQKLHGRFLHITDIHPDPFYQIYSSTEANVACHRHQGPAGYWGAETSDCDSPLQLVNATFKWIEENLKDKIDFIIWTGDSARHDNDEKFPRTTESVIQQNQFLVDKFREVFGSSSGSSNRLSIPIVPSFGNNDILPHNLFFKGPNEWTKAYSSIWRPFIPEEQRHGFDRGGWFYVEVIPNKLAVFSLNTMYFFDSNTAVDGCASHSEPGYEHFEWLRIQLQFLRQRGVKAIISGHVPPARNDEKVGWDETCWQKYALWMQQYRDVIIGSMYGHMNLEHFVLQDFNDIDYAVAAGLESPQRTKERNSDDISIKLNTPDYLNALRDMWSKLPRAPDGITSSKSKKHEDKRTDEQKFYDKIRGEHAERYAVSLVAASVVPNFFSSIRVFEYNITGLEDAALTTMPFSPPVPSWQERMDDGEESEMQGGEELAHHHLAELKRRSLWDIIRNPLHADNKKKKKNHEKPDFVVPDPPSSTSSPGPGYSPQTLSFISYTQYFANNTHLNNDLSDYHGKEDIHVRGWNPGKYVDKRPGKLHSAPRPLNFTYEVEYDTQDEKDDWRFGVGLTVRKFVDLAARIGEYESEDGSSLGRRKVHSDSDDDEDEDEGEEDAHSDDDTTAIKHKKKKGKHHKERKKRRKITNRNWFAFCSRAVVATMDEDELHERFGEEED